MSFEQYQWVIAMAAAWSAPADPNDLLKPLMDYIDGVSGRLAPNDWTPANDGAAQDEPSAMLVLALISFCAKFHGIFTIFRRNCAISVFILTLAANPHSCRADAE
ncbi:hypothetical protein [Janthinobacterium aquaticum]|uniref:hypothetical protein n=1 Tax=Janthinobacterium sp. FT58W TaxID=2654254 RepID=UPI0012656447|nr:hypothetical protein [Janthinobacterium sp. FT58W]KAB8037378.1 hypothetical protein GCM43_23505 [Janthinobacterium sp. FT58W]